MYLSQLGHAIRVFRQARGLTQAELAAGVGLSRTTVNQLENGVFPDIGVNKVMSLLHTLGQDLAIVPIAKKSAPDYIRMAASSASVSYTETLAPEVLERIILTGKAPPNFHPHLRVVFDELPPKVMAGIAQALGASTNLPKIRKNLESIAAQIGTKLRLAP
jgi:transcriptional regulator with XRE-family HTH domain